MAEETINPLFTPLIEPLNSICFSNASIDNIYIKYEVFIRFIKSIQCKLNVHLVVHTVKNIFLLLSQKIICHFCIVHLFTAWLKMYAFINNDFKNDSMISSWLEEWNRKCYFKLKDRCFYHLTKIIYWIDIQCFNFM